MAYLASAGFDVFSMDIDRLRPLDAAAGDERSCNLAKDRRRSS